MIAPARRLLESAGRIVCFSGAGLSAESGVPTFRDAAGSGLWSQFDPAKLASPDGFARDPTLVNNWYSLRRRAIAGASPNAAHRALAARPDISHITQNVDDLLHRAGAANTIHLHGRIDRDRCHAACGYVESIDMANPPELRPCPMCGAWLRPDVVWFGELLPPDGWHAAEKACVECDVLLVVGTSAVVCPAAALIQLAARRGARIIIVNTRRSEASHLADIECIGPASEIVPMLV